MPSCLSENTVVAVLEGAHSGARRDELHAHIAECDRCRELVRTLTTTGAAATEQAAPARAPQAQLPEPGDCVGRYRIERVLGVGGMGVVYRAHDPELGRDIAVKLIHPELGATSESVTQRLVRESRAMAQLAHPNVLAVYDVGRTAGQVFIAMELAAGGTLGQWVAGARRDWREILARFCQAGRGLQAAHESGLVHRDFKPDNVLLTTSGSVRVADFGLVGSDGVSDSGELDVQGADEPVARVSLTRSGARIGTPLYMAPEQHDGGRVGPAADQFAFAVAVYQALCGAHPFADPIGTYADLVCAIKSGRVRETPEASEIPAGIRDVLLRGLRVDPRERWPSMRAMLDSLDRQLAAAPAAEPSDPEERARTAELRRQLDHVRALAESGRFGEALPAARALTAAAAALGNAALLAEAMYRQGSIEVDSGDARAGERSLSEAAVAAARAHDDGLAARIWSDLLVVVGHREGRSAEAQLLRPAAEAALARCGDDPVVQARFVNSLGIVLSDHGNYAAAVDSFERAAALYAEALGPDDPELGKVHNNLGYTLTRLGAYEQARAHHERARAIWERSLGPEHPHVASCFNNLGELALEQNRLDEAAALHERALTIRERTLRPDHPFTALSLHNLAAVRHRQSRPADARYLHERALALRLATLGADHPDTAESHGGLGAALVALGMHEAGRDQHERALTIVERVRGPQHPQAARVLVGLARAELGLGRHAEAIAAATRALEIADRHGMSGALRDDIRALLATARDP